MPSSRARLPSRRNPLTPYLTVSLDQWLYIFANILRNWQWIKTLTISGVKWTVHHHNFTMSSSSSSLTKMSGFKNWVNNWIEFNLLSTLQTLVVNHLCAPVLQVIGFVFTASVTMRFNRTINHSVTTVQKMDDNCKICFMNKLPTLKIGHPLFKSLIYFLRFPLIHWI